LLITPIARIRLALTMVNLLTMALTYSSYSYLATLVIYLNK